MTLKQEAVCSTAPGWRRLRSEREHTELPSRLPLHPAPHKPFPHRPGGSARAGRLSSGSFIKAGAGR